MRKQLYLMALLGFTPIAASAALYKVDPDHSQVTFKVRHLLGKVTGRFDRFDGSFELDSKNLKAFKAMGSIEASSINTNTPKRDDHLRSADFFDVKNFPTLSFTSKGISNLARSKAKMKGDLTIHGVTKPVIFDVEFLGEAKDPWGNERASLTAVTVIKRADFGLTWNEAIETGGVLVGEDVEIILEIEGIKPQ